MSTKTYDALLRAGAPHIPDGYFYRVKSPSALGTIKVQLRKRRKFGSKWLGEGTHWLPTNGSNVTADAFVAEICRLLVDRYDWEERIGTRFDRELSELVGDHP